jgi:hypothetical protein
MLEAAWLRSLTEPEGFEVTPKQLVDFAEKVVEAGFDDPRLAATILLDEVPSMVAQALDLPEDAVEKEVLIVVEGWVKAATPLAAWRTRTSRWTSSLLLDDVLAVALQRRKAAKIELPRSSEAGELRAVPARGTLGRKAKRARKDTDLLKERDADAEAQWRERFRALLAWAGVPSIVAVQAASSPDAALKGLIGKARPATVRLRVRTWEAYRRWLDLKKGVVWPAEVSDVLDYIHEQLQDEAPMTFASSFGASLRWMEARSGLPYEQRFGDADVVRLNLAQAEKQLEEGTVRRQACRLMVVMVVAMELMVLDTTVGIAFRVLAWMRLIKLYATMRADDLQRLRPEDVHLGPSGLKGILRRSKTTGAAKRVKTLPIFVPKEASVSGVDWLNVGYTLWKEAADFERDFFMPRVVPDGSGFWRKCPTPGDLVAMGEGHRALEDAPEGGRWRAEWCRMAADRGDARGQDFGASMDGALRACYAPECAGSFWRGEGQAYLPRAMVTRGRRRLRAYASRGDQELRHDLRPGGEESRRLGDLGRGRHRRRGGRCDPG